MKSISFLGVIVGAVLDIALSALLGAVFSLLVWRTHVQSGEHVSPQQIASLTETSPLFGWVSWVGGGAMSVLGGYIAATIAKRHEVLNGALSSFLCIVSSIFSIASGDTHMMIFAVPSLVVSPLLGAAGGWLRNIQMARRISH